MIRARPGAAWAALLFGVLWSASSAGGERVPGGYRQVAAAHGVPASLLYSVALAESGRVLESTGTFRPWPWTLNVAGQGAYYPSRTASWAALRSTLSRGERSVDVGLMQVSWRYHADALASAWRALDPYHNLHVAARILRECARKRGDWWSAVGCYHAPNDAARAARYRRRVGRHWRRVAASG